MLAETWDGDGDTVWLLAPDDRPGATGSMVVEVIGKFYCLDGCPEVVRARVAGVAPEALRMLLDLEWAHNDGERYYFAVCHNAEESGHGPEDQVGHATDCSWLALMKKAGLR